MLNLEQHVVHLMYADKFTIPLVKKLREWYGSSQHTFLIVCGENEQLPFIEDSCVKKIVSPIRKHFIYNTRIIFKVFKIADKVVLHGLPLMFYLLLFPNILKKTGWIIYGGADLYLYDNEVESIKSKVLNFARKFVLKRISFHLTHIEGDSELANQIYQSKAKFYYNPVYPSNIVITENPPEPISHKSESNLRVLVGSSTDPSNNHKEIFEWLKNIKNIEVICPLSYGPYQEYKEEIKTLGKHYFGSRFEPIENFMSLVEYRSFLNGIDIAVFNHKRQEAMGVTITLMNLGKIIFMNPETTSFQSFIKRGYAVFSNTSLPEAIYHLENLKVNVNKQLLEEYYSESRLKESWDQIYYVKTKW